MSKKLKKGCIVFMKTSSGLVGYGNSQCVSKVHHESLGTISLYGHNQHYRTYDIDRIVEYPDDQHDQLQAEVKDKDEKARLFRIDVQEAIEALIGCDDEKALEILEQALKGE